MRSAHRPRTRVVILALGGIAIGACADSSAPSRPGAIIVSTNIQLAIDGSPFAYRILVDTLTIPVPSSDFPASYRIGPLRPGPHTVSVEGLSATCTSGTDSRVVALRGGDTVSVTFNIQCTRTTGDIVVTAATTGTDVDPDGYVLTLDNAFARSLTRNGTRSFLRVLPGARTVRVFDVESNCTLAGTAARPVTVVAAQTISLGISVSCTAIGAGLHGFTATDPVADTLPNTTSTTPSIDVVRVDGRYTAGWLLLSLHFSTRVVASSRNASNSLYGFVDLDVDESEATGVQPGINSYGGDARQGIEYEISFNSGDTASVALLSLDANPTLIGATFDADSVVVRVPLNKIGNDDGNLSLTIVLGTRDRPTDIAPTTGFVLARAPGAPTVAAAGAQRSRSPTVAPGPSSGGWRWPHSAIPERR